MPPVGQSASVTPLPRTLEPEAIDDVAEARVYDRMDHREVNRRFVDDLLAGGPIGQQVIDLGTGTARIAIALCRRLPEVKVMAIDASTAMLDLAVTNVDVAGVIDQVQLEHADATTMDEFDDAICDCVISNSVLHHVSDPEAVLRTASRLVRPGGRLFIRDLMRPATAAEVDRLTELHAGGEPAEAKQLLRQSLHAALTLEEARGMLTACGLPAEAVQATSDRHWTIDASK